MPILITEDCVCVHQIDFQQSYQKPTEKQMSPSERQCDAQNAFQLQRQTHHMEEDDKHTTAQVKTDYNLIMSTHYIYMGGHY